MSIASELLSWWWKALAVFTSNTQNSQHPASTTYSGNTMVLAMACSVLIAIATVWGCNEAYAAPEPLTVENSSASPQALAHLQQIEEKASKGESPFASATDSTSSALDSFFGPANNSQPNAHTTGSDALQQLSQGNSASQVNNHPSFTQALEKTLTISNQELPFELHTEQQGNVLRLNFSLRGQSYLYQNSLSLMAVDKGVIFAAPQLPPSTQHTDALGTAEVFFSELSLEIPLLQGKTGQRLRLSYQGCDEDGICYPPQRVNIELTEDITAPNEEALINGKTLWAATGMPKSNPNTEFSERNAGQQDSTDAESVLDQDEEMSWGDFDLITEENYSNALSKTIADNLVIGMLLCFVLGLGLDLTPCVLPMLPIFSAMIIGNAKQTSTKDTQSGTNTTNTKSGRRWGVLLLQNSAYALGLSITYTILGLLMSLLGSSLHSVLQSPTVLIIIAVLLLICALACADVIELQVPSAITSKLQKRISVLNTSNFYGAFMLGALSALIASPCTSAPLAGALLYVMQNGNLWVGGLSFFAIGLGMATPLLIIGIFGSKFLQRSSFIGDLVRRLLVIILLITAYYLVEHLLGRFELLVSTLLVYIITLYVLASIGTYIRKRQINMMITLMLAVVSLIPTYFAFGYLENHQLQKYYEQFTLVKDLEQFDHVTQNEYSYVVFTAKWCTNCKFMENTIYSQPDFLENTDNIKLVVVDITDAQDPNIQDIMKRYQIIGVPFYMTLNAEGQILHSQLGLSPKKQVLKSLEELHEQRYQDFMSTHDH